MGNYTTVADLKADALHRAGELTDGTSDYDTLAVQYLNRAILGLLIGGPFGTMQGQPLLHIPLIDWEWARSYPPGAFVPSDPSTSGGVTVNHGLDSLSVTSPPSGVSLVNWHLRVANEPTVIRIKTHIAGQTSATLQTVWPHATYSPATSDFDLFKIEYDLETDFLRFVDTLRVSVSPYVVPVVDQTVLENEFPLSLVDKGVPQLAALVQPRTIRLSHFVDTNQPYQVSYEYVKKPADLTVGGADPPMPITQRPLLALAAAVLILIDKQDGRAVMLAQELSSMLASYAQEDRHTKRQRSLRYGQMQPRREQVARLRQRVLSYEVP